MATGNKYVEHKMESNDQARVFRRGLRMNSTGGVITSGGNATNSNGEYLNINGYTAIDRLRPDVTFSISFWGKNLQSISSRRSTTLATDRLQLIIYSDGIFWSNEPTNSSILKTTTLTLTRQNDTKMDHIVVTNQGGNGYNVNNLKVYLNGIDIDSVGVNTQSNLTKVQYDAGLLRTLRDAAPINGGFATSSFIVNNSHMADFMICEGYVITPNEVRQMFNRGTNDINLYATHYPATVMAARTIHYSFDDGNYTGLVLRNLVTPGTFDATISNQATPNLIDLY
jgi:hypothetical protein